MDKIDDFTINARYVVGEGNKLREPHNCGIRCLPFCIIVHVKQGEYHCEIDGKRYTVRDNQAIIVPEGIRNITGMEKIGTVNWAHACYHWKGRDILSYYKYPIIATGNNAETIANSCFELANISQSESFDQTLKNASRKNTLMFDMLGAILNEADPLIPQLSSEAFVLIPVLDYIDKNLSKKITVEKLAEIAGLAQTSFIAKFKGAIGLSPIDYVIWQRMQNACKMLFAEDMPIKEVAAALGYDDPLYFSKLFKKIIGVTPSSYRDVISSQLP